MKKRLFLFVTLLSSGIVVWKQVWKQLGLFQVSISAPNTGALPVTGALSSQIR